MKKTTSFEEIRNFDENQNEYWFARDLQKVLNYEKWDKFKNVIDKAKKSCIQSNNLIDNHFLHVEKMVNIGSNAIRYIEDVKLSRYACYLIVQNGDPSKKVIALGQTYFAIKTREKELQENFDALTESEKRIKIRSDLKEHNKYLAQAAKSAGIKSNLDYAIFQNHGYKGLYNGLDVRDIHLKKRLRKNQKRLDYMGSTELAANLFRATQTDEKLRREKISDKNKANLTHFFVGKKVRQTIKELGGTMPEDLPTPEESINQLKQNKIKRIK